LWPQTVHSIRGCGSPNVTSSAQALGVELGLVVAAIVAAVDHDRAPAEAPHRRQRDRLRRQAEIWSRPEGIAAS
jgi:hypothetical protein